MRANLLSDTILFIAAAGYEQKALGTYLNLDWHLKSRPLDRQYTPLCLTRDVAEQRLSSVLVPPSPGGV